MKIDKIELFHVAMPLIYPWKTAYGEDAEIHSVLCRMSSGSVSAWGESAPLAAPCYSPEWGGGVFEVVRRWLAPMIVGREIPTGEYLQQQLGAYKGNPFAKAVLDNTWWSLHSAIECKPLHVLLGGDSSVIPVGADFGIMDSLDDLLREISGAVMKGFRRIKLKFRPGWDRSMVEAVRNTFPKTVFHIDCNAGYSIQDQDMFRGLDEYDLAMIEQPLGHDDLIHHAALSKHITTPICLDESVASMQLAMQAIELNSCAYVNVKPGRVGGLTIARQIHNLCHAAGVPCWVGGMLESSTGGAICTALASLPNFTSPADIFPSDRYYENDLSAEPIELISDESGRPALLPFKSIPAPNSGRLKQWCLQSAVL